MSIGTAKNVERGHEAWTRDHWLRHCEGYSVEAPDGQVGYVEKVVLAPGEGAPAAFTVRTGFGLGRRLVVLPIEDVREICPSQEKILVATGQSDSGTISIAPHGHSAAQIPQPLQKS